MDGLGACLLGSLACVVSAPAGFIALLEPITAACPARQLFGSEACRDEPVAVRERRSQAKSLRLGRLCCLVTSASGRDNLRSG